MVNKYAAQKYYITETYRFNDEVTEELFFNEGIRTPEFGDPIKHQEGQYNTGYFIEGGCSSEIKVNQMHDATRHAATITLHVEQKNGQTHGWSAVKKISGQND